MFQLYDYQQRLVDETRQAITSGSKGVFVQSPAGSGKSVVIAEIARLATEKENHVLFIVHRKELAEQIKKTFIKNEVDMDYVTIQTVIKAYNRREKIPYPQLIITDETHHSRAKTYQKLYKYFSEAFRLGFSATPWRMNGKGFADIYDTLVEGESVKWLIENNRLAPYRYFAENSIDRSHLKKNTTGDYDAKSVEEEFKGSRIFGDIVRHYKKYADGQKAIAYAPTIVISEMIAGEFQKSGIKAVHCDGKTPKKEREKIMQDFRDNKIDVLCNVDLISEGFDVPDCSCVILARPTKSLVLFIQQSMRAMRYQPNKTAIILDHVGNLFEHGLPDADREWTLKDRPGKGRKKSEPSTVKQCPDCMAWMDKKETKCSICGHEFKTEPKDPEFVDGELEEVNKETFTLTTDYTKINRQEKWRGKSKDDLESLEDYYYFAEARGYKKSWIKFNYPPMKNKPWPVFYQYINQLESII